MCFLAFQFHMKLTQFGLALHQLPERDPIWPLQVASGDGQLIGYHVNSVQTGLRRWPIDRIPRHYYLSLGHYYLYYTSLCYSYLSQPCLAHCFLHHIDPKSHEPLIILHPSTNNCDYLALHIRSRLRQPTRCTYTRDKLIHA